MRSCNKTAPAREANCHDDTCKLQKCHTCSDDGGKPRTIDSRKIEGSCGVWIKNPFPALKNLSKVSINSEKLLAVYMTLLEFAHNLWEAAKPTFASTNSKSVSRFSRRTSIPPSSWTACEYVLQVNFKIAHIAG